MQCHYVISGGTGKSHTGGPAAVEHVSMTLEFDRGCYCDGCRAALSAAARLVEDAEDARDQAARDAALENMERERAARDSELSRDA